jgi:triacylglycerol esterase/lipase EstA (alpha/beta hydrolase family)
MRHLRKTLRVAVLASVAVTTVTGQGQAQVHPVVLVHGINSDGSSWSDTRGWLESQLVVPVYNPSFYSRAALNEQAEYLKYFLDNTFAGVPAPVLVGHSQGGIISRLAGQMRPVGGIVTVGTPHFGAAAAGHYGMVQSLLGEISVGIGSLAGFAYWPSSRCDLWCPSYLVGMATGYSRLFQSYLGSASSRYLGRDPAFGDLTPGSSLIAYINGSEFLAGEQGMGPIRYSLRVTAEQYYMGGPARLLMSGGAAYGVGMTFLGAYYYIMQEVYRGEGAIDYSDSGSWAYLAAFVGASNLASILYNHADLWCSVIGTAHTGYQGASACGPSDALVPYGSMLWPGAVNDELFGPSHTDQTTDPLVRDYLARRLRPLVNP